MRLAIVGRDSLRLAVNCCRMHAEVKRNFLFFIKFRRPQIEPRFVEIAFEISFGQRRTLIRRRFLRADHGDRAFMAALTQGNSRLRARLPRADDHYALYRHDISSVTTAFSKTLLEEITTDSTPAYSISRLDAYW